MHGFLYRLKKLGSRSLTCAELAPVCHSVSDPDSSIAIDKKDYDLTGTLDGKDEEPSQNSKMSKECTWYFIRSYTYLCLYSVRAPSVIPFALESSEPNRDISKSKAGARTL